MKYLIFIIILFLFTACTPNEMDFKSDVPVESWVVEPVAERIVELPGAINLDVPFFSQAPDADWDLPWQEACEEASVILAYHYVTEKELDRDLFRQSILDLVQWEVQHFGSYEHTTIAQTAEILRGYYGFSDFEIVESPSVDDLKKELSLGHVIIAPFAGRQLGNPFYSGEGPYYHMMVIRGYDEKHFITNDVGTKRGENFIYSYDVLISAMHDWHNEDINFGEKKVIVLN
ncbi:hypothetical protein COY07_04825 [Candidatus Peregrinibacteria bacterium CG_4_10_14_0_2_um_filter_43_11]|nr:MAG: hypothetical protein COY07_04825 [Candidatus Peregrinibacteria bacterium CG_4_10_14_0_2_um_filter_43_11]